MVFSHNRMVQIMATVVDDGSLLGIMGDSLQAKAGMIGDSHAVGMTGIFPENNRIPLSPFRLCRNYPPIPNIFVATSQINKSTTQPIKPDNCLLLKMDIEKFRQQAKDQKKINKKFLQNLKKQNSRELDVRFHHLHEKVFEEINCLDCANCCKTTSPIFMDKDIERLAKHFRIRPTEFIEKYLYLDHENDYVLNEAPCPFLGPDNYCSVYEDRPRACREYPHTDRRKIHQLLDLTFKNTLVCPAVLEIVNRLKAVY